MSNETNHGEKPFKYWAFISYSHRDADWARWLHRRLEGYRLPTKLIKHPDGRAPLPARLSPIFRDQDELPTSSDLGDVLTKALESSRHLIVICSPNSAKSRWVNEEILTFKRLGRADNIHLLIVGGEPNASATPDPHDEECFPSAAMHGIDANGQESDVRLEPIAADARPGHGTRHDAMLRLIAGMLNVGFDEIKRRDLVRRQRRLVAVVTVTAMIAVAMTGLAVAALFAKREADFQRHEAEVAKGDAEDQRDEAKKQRNIATEQRDEATRQRQAAEQREAEARRQQYLAIMNLARKSWQDGQPRQMVDLLYRVLPQPGKEDLRGFEWNYLWRLAYGDDLVKLTGHDGPVLAVACSADGRTIATGGNDGTVKVWDAKTHQLRRSLAPALGGIGAALKEEDGKLVVVELIKGGAAEVGGQLQVGDQVLALQVDNQWVPYPSGGMDGFIRFIRGDVGTEVKLRVLPKDSKREAVYAFKRTGISVNGPPVHQVLIHPKGRLVYAASQDFAIRIWNMVTGKLVASLPMYVVAHGRPMAISPDGSLLISLSIDNKFRFWHAISGRFIRAAPVANCASWSFIDFPPEGNAVLAGNPQQVTTFSISPFKPVKDVGAGLAGAGIDPMDLSYDGASVSYGSQSGVVRVGDSASGAIRNFLSGHKGRITAAQFSRDGARLGTGGADNTVRLWDLDQDSQVAAYRGHYAGVTSVAFSADDRSLVSADMDGVAIVWDLSRDPESEVLSTERFVKSLAFSRDSKRLVTGGGTETLEALKQFFTNDRGEVVEWNLAENRSAALQTSVNRPSHASIAGDGKTLALAYGAPGSRSGEVRLLDLASQKMRPLAELAARPISGMAFSPDSTLLAICASVPTNPNEVSFVSIYDRQTGNRVAHYVERAGPAISPKFSLDGKTLLWNVSSFNSSRPALVRLWDVQKRQVRATLTHGGGNTNLFQLSPNGQYIASVMLSVLRPDDPPDLRVFSLATGKEQCAIEGLKKMVSSMAFSPDGKHLAVATGNPVAQGDGQLQVFSADTGARLQELQEHKGVVRGIVFSPDGETMITNGSDRLIIYWNAQTWKHHRKIHLLQPFGDLTMSPDGKHFISVSSNGFEGTALPRELKIFSLDAQEKTRTIPLSAAVLLAHFLPDGKSFLTLSLDQGVSWWDSETLQEKSFDSAVSDAAWHQRPVYAVALANDDATIATGCEDRLVKIWDAKTKKVVRTLKGHTSPVQCLIFSDDGKTLYSGSGGHDSAARKSHPGQILKWDVASGNLLETLYDGEWAISSLALSPDGCQLAASDLGEPHGRGSGTVRLYDLATGKPPQSLASDVPTGQVFDVAYSPDGRQLAVAYSKHPVVIWNLSPLRPLRDCRGRSAGASSIAFSPDGKTLASLTLFTDEVVLWHVDTGEELITLTPSLSTGYHGVARFSPDGRMLAVGGIRGETGRGAVQIWRAPSTAEADAIMKSIRDAATSQKKEAPAAAADR